MSAADRFTRLAAGLRDVASGKAAQRAADRLKPEIVVMAQAAMAGHSRSGAALASIVVTGTPAGVSITCASYLKYHAWWPFHDGVPAEVADRYRALLAEEIRGALR